MQTQKLRNPLKFKQFPQYFVSFLCYINKSITTQSHCNIFTINCQVKKGARPTVFFAVGRALKLWLISVDFLTFKLEYAAVVDNIIGVYEIGVFGNRS